MSLRSEIRRRKRETEKSKPYKPPAPVYIGNQTPEDIAKKLGVNVDLLYAWANKFTEEQSDKAASMFQSRYGAAVDEMNVSLEKMRAEYNRCLKQNADNLEAEYNKNIDELVAEWDKRFRKAEDYACLEQLMVCLVCLHITWGYTKGLQKFVANYQAACKYVESTGVKAVFESYCKDYGLNLEFDSFEVESWLHGTAKERCDGKSG